MNASPILNALKATPAIAARTPGDNSTPAAETRPHLSIWRGKKDTLGLGLCMGVIFVAILAIWPLGEMGYIDDWSYAFMTLKASRTGQLSYNGWSAPMLGIQTYWGAAWIRLAGFSFTTLRLSTLPFVAGCAVLLYSLFRACGLRRSLVVFGVIGVLASPLTLPLECSFMSDIPALFFLLVCFWCCQRIVEAPTTRAFLAWCALLCAAGLAGGTIRQTDWLAPFVIFPALALAAPKSRRMALGGFWLLGVAGAAALDYWLLNQTHYYSLPLLNTNLWLFPILCTFLNTATLVMELLALMFPALCLVLLARWKAVRVRWVLWSLAGLGLVYLVGFLITKFRPVQLMAGNMVTQWGLLIPGTELLGDKPVVLPYWLQFFIVMSAAVLSMMLARVWPYPPALSLRRLSVAPSRLFVVPFVVFAALYLASVTTRSLTLSAFDRYLIPVFPLAFMAVLAALQKLGVSRPSIPSVVLLAIFAGWGVAVTHDYFAESRARLEAAGEVLRSGVTREKISAGMEFDAWTELTGAGFVPNVPPKYAHGKLPETDHRKDLLPKSFWFWPYTPSVDPKYILSLSPVEGLHASGFAPVEYRAWLPPFTRTILIQRGRS